jgi:ribulose kinase
MKLFAAVLLGTTMALTMALAGPVMAQDKDGMSNMRDRSDAPMRHRMTRHHSYQWSYKSEQDEHQATEELNRQYRGVPQSDQAK